MTQYLHVKTQQRTNSKGKLSHLQDTAVRVLFRSFIILFRNER